MTWSFDLICISATKRGNGILRNCKDISEISLNFSLKMETGNRSSLVNGIEAGFFVEGLVYGG